MKVDVFRARIRCEFESKIEQRHQLMMALLWLLQECPGLSANVCVTRYIGTTQSQVNYGIQFPYWFESPLRLNLGNGFYSLTTEDVRAAVADLERTYHEVSASAIG
jgi:hypothetical protein